MPRASVHGVDVFFRDEGEGEPIVFGHCSAGSSGQWRDPSNGFQTITEHWLRTILDTAEQGRIQAACL